MTRRVAPRRVRAAAALALILASVPTASSAALLGVPVNDDYTTDFEERIEVDAPGVLANDLNIGDDRAELTNDVDHGDLTLRNDGSFDYTPDDGFVGTDQFRYRLEGLLSTSATVRITVLPPPPTPVPTPPPTPKPTPPPTPKPTSTPTPRPSSILPLPLPTILPLPLPTLPLPTLPPLLPTPTPSPSPVPTATPAASPTSVAGGGPVTSGPTGGGGVGIPIGPGPDAPAVPADQAVAIAGPGTAVDVTGGLDTGGISVEWFVPTIAVTLPGLLLMLAVLAQSLGALAWIPVVRRGLGDFGVRRRSREDPEAGG